MKQRQYSASEVEWANALYKQVKIERRGRLNVPTVDSEGELSLLPSLGDFSLFGRDLKHLGGDDTENRVVVGSLAGTAAWNALYKNAHRSFVMPHGTPLATH